MQKNAKHVLNHSPHFVETQSKLGCCISGFFFIVIKHLYVSRSSETALIKDLPLPLPLAPPVTLCLAGGSEGAAKAVRGHNVVFTQ